jgi:hypothetical protein
MKAIEYLRLRARQKHLPSRHQCNGVTENPRLKLPPDKPLTKKWARHRNRPALYRSLPNINTRARHPISRYHAGHEPAREQGQRVYA